MVQQFHGEVRAQFVSGWGVPIDPQDSHGKSVAVRAIRGEQVEREDGGQEDPLVFVVWEAGERHCGNCRLMISD